MSVVFKFLKLLLFFLFLGLGRIRIRVSRILDARSELLKFGSATAFKFYVNKQHDFILNQCCGSGSAWIRNFHLDPELGKFKAGSGINHSGSATLFLTTDTTFQYMNLYFIRILVVPDHHLNRLKAKIFYLKISWANFVNLLTCAVDRIQIGSALSNLVDPDPHN